MIDPDDIFSDDYLAQRRKRYESADQILDELRAQDPEKHAKRYRAHTRKKTEKGPEHYVKERCRLYLEQQLGARVLRTNAGSMLDQEGRTIYLGDAGQADLHAVVPIRLDELGIAFTFGIFFAIECKAANNAPTEKQQNYLASIKARGGVAIVAYSPLDIDAAVTALRAEMLAALAGLDKRA